MINTETSLSENSAISLKKIIGRDELQQLIDDKIIFDKVTTVEVNRDVQYQFHSGVANLCDSKCTFIEDDEVLIEGELIQEIQELDEESFVRHYSEDSEIMIESDDTNTHSYEESIDEFFRYRNANFNLLQAWKNLNETYAKEYVIVTILTENLNHEGDSEFSEKRVLVSTDYLNQLEYVKDSSVNYEQYLNREYLN